jgi:cytochrome c-type biogenesis protein CcmH/NrfF
LPIYALILIIAGGLICCLASIVAIVLIVKKRNDDVDQSDNNVDHSMRNDVAKTSELHDNDKAVGASVATVEQYGSFPIDSESPSMVQHCF